MEKQLTALLVMPQERRSRLMAHLKEIDANILTACSCGEATDLLRGEPEVALVLTDLSLPDGSWFDVLNSVGDVNARAAVVVCARVADERLWTQVLEAGGFDVLVEPYQDHEVRRILAAAATGRHASQRLAAAC
jgi:DNA-binding NtrC family response regulator